MTNLLGTLLMAAISFPVSFWIARGGLNLVVRFVSPLLLGGPKRHVL